MDILLMHYELNFSIHNIFPKKKERDEELSSIVKVIIF